MNHTRVNDIKWLLRKCNAIATKTKGKCMQEKHRKRRADEKKRNITFKDIPNKPNK